MSGVPPYLHNQLIAVLNECGTFDNQEHLEAVFNDPRLRVWKNNVPSASTRAARVQLIVSTLIDAWDTHEQNGLVMLLFVLKDLAPPETACYRRLADLAPQLEQAIINERIAACEQDLKQLQEHLDRGWADPTYGANRKKELNAQIERWQKRLEKTQKAPETIVSQREIVASEVTAEKDTYTDFEVHISPANTEPGKYKVKAELGDGSTFTEQLILDEKLQIFTGQINKAYIRAETLAETQTEKRLRFRLWIDNDAAELHALVWERLHYPTSGGERRLATSADRPFSRYIGLTQSEPGPVTERPARMLFAISNPANLEKYSLKSLNVEQELKNLMGALGDLHQLTNLEVTVMPGRTSISSPLLTQLENAGYQVQDGPTTIDNVIDMLARGQGYHILHYLGHGQFNRHRNQSALFFEDSIGSVEQIREMELAGWLQDAGQLPHLIFLAACESAKRVPGERNPFVGLAPRLIAAGVPAVVAMQDFLPVDAARILTHYFYRSLLDHGIVDKAMNQTRMMLARNNTDLWSIPVLFMRLKEGRLF
ncbi:MAG: CHAT domain-containing protein [Anaerolineae bacterium]|nr:CHAT domain-containing protein [Anaerolineae bacterium]